MSEASPTMSFSQLVAESLEHVEEIFPWDLEELIAGYSDVLLLDVREPHEYAAMHIRNSINVPRGILESACDWGYEETIPDLVQARERDIIVICRSGNRSALACEVMQRMGYRSVRSLKTGLRGWNDYEQELVDENGNVVDIEAADAFFASKVSKEQLGPQAA